MQVTVNIDRAAAIMAGYDGPSTAEVEIDLSTLTEQQRSVLADRVYLTVASPTTDRVLAAIDEIVSKRKAEAAQKHAKIEAFLAHSPQAAAECGSSSKIVRIHAWRAPDGAVVYRQGAGDVDVRVPDVPYLSDIPADLADAVEDQRQAYGRYAEQLIAAAQPLALAVLEKWEAERAQREAEKAAAAQRLADALAAETPVKRSPLADMSADERTRARRWVSHEIVRELGLDWFERDGEGEGDDDPVRAKIRTLDASDATVSVPGTYIATITPDAAAPGGFDRTWWEQGKGSGYAIAPDDLAPADLIEYGYSKDRKGRKVSPDRRVMIDRDDEKIYLLAIPDGVSPKTAKKIADTVRAVVDAWESAAPDESALRAEREKLLARVAEIDAVLGGAA